ncbi:MAG TPA: hypothetical protein VFG76_09995, partial [Candidatus Polarisedimenticolia bacterium]|nr:hypothetical protein [Candidatus Polarisedimenticolia bacterium]
LYAETAARSISKLEGLAQEAGTVGLLPLVSPARVAVARLHLEAGRTAEGLRACEEAIAAAGPLRQREMLFQAHRLAASALLKRGKAQEAIEHARAALSALEEMRTGLKPAEGGFLAGRPSTVSFRTEAGELFQSQNLVQELERLKSLATASP